jgi:hypothetical protein
LDRAAVPLRLSRHGPPASTRARPRPSRAGGNKNPGGRKPSSRTSDSRTSSRGRP